MKRLAIILPYNEEHIENFVNHFDATVDGDYKLVFMKQKSNRPLNKGKLFNIGYMLHKDKFDYFCFHDSDLIPISYECDYSYEEKPISLVGMRNKIEFGDQEKVQNFDDYSLPYDEYFGGAVLFSKEHYEQINGYSNEYWGSGYEDYDLLFRCVVRGLSVRIELGKNVSKTYGNFNGMNSYIEIPAENTKIKNATNKSFSISTWFCPNGEPPYGADVDSNRCEYSIFMRPGYHTGLSYIHGRFLKGVIWIRKEGSNEREPVLIKVPFQRTTVWSHIGMVVDDKEQTLTLYVNGKEAGKKSYEGQLVEYLNKPYYIGVGNPTTTHWRNFYKGQIAEVGLWSDTLNDYEMELIFNKGIVNNKGEYVTSKLPVGVWNFKSGYDDITFDMSGNGNHAKFYNVKFANKSLKSNTERYLPYRRNGAYGYLSSHDDYLNLENLTRTKHDRNGDGPEIMTNRKTFNKKVGANMRDVDIDGLTSTRFRIVNRQDYQEKHEIIEVLI